MNEENKAKLLKIIEDIPARDLIEITKDEDYPSRPIHSSRPKNHAEVLLRFVKITSVLPCNRGIAANARPAIFISVKSATGFFGFDNSIINGHVRPIVLTH